MKLKNNPILNTAWLEKHAMTLKNNIAKYHFGEKILCIPSESFLLKQ
jgi:hypothetical protein